MAMIDKDPRRWRDCVNFMTPSLYEDISVGKENSGEAIKSFIEAFCTDMKYGDRINPTALKVFAERFDIFLTEGKSLDEAFLQKKGRGRPKKYDELFRNFSIGLIVLQLNRGWLTQSDIDAIPVQYDKDVTVNFEQQTLEAAYEQTGKLFSLSEESIKQIYKDVIDDTNGLSACTSESELRRKLKSIF